MFDVYHPLRWMIPYIFLSCRKNWCTSGVNPSGLGCFLTVLHMGFDCGIGFINFAIWSKFKLPKHNDSWFYLVHLFICPCICSTISTQFQHRVTGLLCSLFSSIKWTCTHWKQISKDSKTHTLYCRYIHPCIYTYM